MRKGTFRYDIRARCEIGDAVALLADIPRLTSRHPLAIRVAELEPGPGTIRSVAVTSRLRLGPLGFLITYRADVVKVTADEVVTVARQKPATTLTNHARFRSEGDGTTHIDVRIDYESPTLLFPYGFGKARQVHRELAHGIKEILEQPAA
ncbi:SRPBCC family protein [Solwaraspora sp. WMMD1047]|uniref:SRPBCC family protein n=1 Tax=Solwaraspora sp. WMMD1047 TaxID=3016102 RepID=UPI00241670E2|nr:SRPBCC family protein [Solwaraspora sp. WMMD1047]MDG4830472.1 SRPBCC family protein [Solwaraspora sp. WMMD1047]